MDTVFNGLLIIIIPVDYYVSHPSLETLKLLVYRV